MRILLIDDHALFRAGLSLLLRDLDPTVDVVQASSVKGAIELDSKPDLVLLDLGLPGHSGIDALLSLREHMDQGVPVVVLSGQDHPAVVRDCIDHGAMGFVLKSSDQRVLQAALNIVMAGSVYLPPSALATNDGFATRSDLPLSVALARLTKRQLDVLGQMVQGKPNKVIGRELGISDLTVKSHVAAVLRELGMNNRTEAVFAIAGSGLTFAPPSAGRVNG